MLARGAQLGKNRDSWPGPHFGRRRARDGGFFLLIELAQVIEPVGLTSFGGFYHACSGRSVGRIVSLEVGREALFFLSDLASGNGFFFRSAQQPFVRRGGRPARALLAALDRLRGAFDRRSRFRLDHVMGHDSELLVLNHLGGPCTGSRTLLRGELGGLHEARLAHCRLACSASI